MLRRKIVLENASRFQSIQCTTNEERMIRQLEDGDNDNDDGNVNVNGNIML